MGLAGAISPRPMANPNLTNSEERSVPPFHPAGHESDGPRRWSADAWVFLREGGRASLASGAAPATYGASQAGAVLRYRLAAESRHRPAAYIRTTAALGGSSEREAALGLSARPLSKLPVIAAVEMRATDTGRGSFMRPAAMLITEIAPVQLVHRLRADVYVQTGYVGGRFATPFVDGQLRVDRGVRTIGPVEVRAGAGVWSGAQKGAARIDAGPAATLGLGLGERASARLAVDWRFRLGGNAAPSSGPALTLSAGF